jgi:hypothetical protein
MEQRQHAALADHDCGELVTLVFFDEQARVAIKLELKLLDTDGLGRGKVWGVGCTVICAGRLE